MTNNPLIKVQSVNKKFVIGDHDIPVLQDVNFTIKEGGFTIIYGPSGSGKSTLLNILIGLDAPTTGNVLYENRDLYALDAQSLAKFRAHTMGMVHQSNYWVKSLTVVENVALPLYFLGYDKDRAAKEALASLQRIGMDQHAHKLPAVLSGGEQQRIAMARALVSNPSYIVADEPTGNLDSKNGDMVMDLLKYFHDKLGRTIILVTHNLEYLPLGEQLLFIQDGKVEETTEDTQQTVDRLMNNMKERITRLNKENTHAIPAK